MLIGATGAQITVPRAHSVSGGGAVDRAFNGINAPVFALHFVPKMKGKPAVSNLFNMNTSSL